MKVKFESVTCYLLHVLLLITTGATLTATFVPFPCPP
jgi:hypothetical protein